MIVYKNSDSPSYQEGTLNRLDGYSIFPREIHCVRHNKSKKHLGASHITSLMVAYFDDIALIAIFYNVPHHAICAMI